MARSFNNITVNNAPLYFDQSLHRRNRFLWEENVQDRCPGTLDTFRLLGCLFSVLRVLNNKKDWRLEYKEDWEWGAHFYRSKKIKKKNSPMGHFQRSFRYVKE